MHLDSSKALQDGSEMAKDVSKMALAWRQGPPSMALRRPRMFPRWSYNGPKTLPRWYLQITEKQTKGRQARCRELGCLPFGRLFSEPVGLNMAPGPFQDASQIAKMIPR